MRDNEHATSYSALANALATNEAFAGFSRLSISLVLTDPRQDDNPIVYVNDAFERTTGYAREAAIGRNCRFLQGENTDKRDVDRIREAIEEGREVSVDILNYRANGTPFLNRLMIAPVADDDGRPLFFLGLQKQLVESDRSADNRITMEHLHQIQGMVRRDLAMVLNSLRESDAFSTQRSGREVDALPRRLEGLQLVYEELRHAARSKRARRLDLGGLIGRVASAIAHEEGRAGIRFVQNVERCEVGIEVGTRIALILSEVLHNAFTHAFASLDEGRIELHLSRLTGGGLRILVTDDGLGLPRGMEWPNQRTAGGRLVRDLLDGLDATLNVGRGAAGTVVMIDVPAQINA